MCVSAVLYWCALIETTIISPSIYITQSYHYLILAYVFRLQAFGFRVCILEVGAEGEGSQVSGV